MGLALAGALVASVISPLLAGGVAGRVFDLGLPCLLFLGAVLISLERAKVEPAEARGWRFLAVSLGLISLGGLIRMAVALGLQPKETLINIALLLQLAGGLLQGWGLLTWPLAPRGSRERWRKALDALVFALALFFILWILGWGGIFSASTEPLTQKLFTLAFPLSSILVLGIAIYLGASQPAQAFKGPLGWITLGLLMTFLGNLGWAVLTLKGTYGRGNAMFDFLAFCIPMARLLAPLSPEPVGHCPERVEAQDLGWFAAALPYLPVLPALALGVAYLMQGAKGWDPVLPWVGVAIVLILLVRQFLAIRDLRVFTSTLEQRVQERTEALEQSQSLMIRTQRMNALASLGAGLAHDLNNLLCASGNYLNLIEADMEDGQPPQVKDLTRAKQAMDRAAELTHQLLAFGREGGPATAFDLGARARAAEPLLKVLLPRSIQLQIDIQEAPLPLIGHPAQVDQILVNLVANARDAMPEGGRITLRARRTDEGMALLEVEDTGQGMSPEVQAKVFDAFFTTKAPGKGTGLGLASVRALVSKAGGQIHLWSALGHGTRFTLELPLA